MRQVRGRVVRAPLAGVKPHRERRAHRQRGLVGCRVFLGLRKKAVAAGQSEGAGVDARRRPAGFRYPAARTCLVTRRRRDRFLHPDAQHGLVHDPGRLALQPVVPPAQRFLKEPDGRPGHAEMRILVRPGPDQPLARYVEPRQQAENGVAIAVGPAADGVHGAADAREVLADRAVLPVGIATLMLQPLGQPQAAVLEAFLPHVAPAVADEQRVRRTGIGIEHGRGPREVVAEQTAAHVMNVVGVTVVGRTQRDDGLELGGLQRRDLQAVEPAPGDADHADIPGAPGLSAQPLENLDAIVELLLQVFITQYPIRFAAASHVDADAGIAVAGPVGMRLGIAHGRQIALAIRQVFENGRHGVALGIQRAPDAHRQPAAVGQRDPVLFLVNLAGKVADDAHETVLPGVSRIELAARGPTSSKAGRA